MARMVASIAASVHALKVRLHELDREKQKIQAAISALTAVDHGEVVTREKGNGHEMSVEAPKRTYSYDFTATCAMCKKEFKAARIVKGTKRKFQYCHAPCTSAQHAKELKQAGAKAIAHEKQRGVTLVKGDTLAAAAGRAH